MGRVLLLNATYEPLQLVSDRRAVVLLLVGRAEAVAEHEQPRLIRSPRVTVSVPSIVRLTTLVRLPAREEPTRHSSGRTGTGSAAMRVLR